MNKVIPSLCAFCCLLFASSEQLLAQLKHEPQLQTTPVRSLIRVDRNYTGSFDELINKEVEVFGYIVLEGKEFGGGPESQSVTTSRGGFTLTNWGPLWWKKNVRIVGTVTKGIDEREKVRKEFGNQPPAMPIRIDYLLTIKSIELLDSEVKQPELVPPAPQFAPQMVPQR